VRLSLEFSLPDELLDLSGILPETMLGRTKAEINRLPVRLSGHPVQLGDVCRVRIASHGKDALHLSGATAAIDHIGWHMTSGILVVQGDAGYGAGEGSPGCKEGMRGGVILVEGNAGRELGSTMRRGLIYVAGDAGDFCASHMLAGTILCAGQVGKYAGAGMRRGSLVAGTMDGILPGFLPAGLADAGWLRLYLAELKGMGIPLPEKWAQESPHRYTGDTLEMGKGEILIHDEPQ
jgi:formylmethanofuran dehydrogenase subunit C